MSLTGAIKRSLYRHLSLENYLRVVSHLYFEIYDLGLGRFFSIYDYPRFLKKLVRKGDVAIDIGANLGYYSFRLSSIVGRSGRVYAVEPVAPVLKILRHNLKRRRNVEILPYALGSENRKIRMINDSAAIAGYMGTGRSRVPDEAELGDDETDAFPQGLEFSAEMRRGSELFDGLDRLDFVKCDVEGYESVVIPEMASVIQKHLPVVLLETGGPDRLRMIELFRGWGYAGYVLQNGRLVSVVRTPKVAPRKTSGRKVATRKIAALPAEKDIVFIPGPRHAELSKLIVR